MSNVLWILGSSQYKGGPVPQVDISDSHLSATYIEIGHQHVRTRAIQDASLCCLSLGCRPCSQVDPREGKLLVAGTEAVSSYIMNTFFKMSFLWFLK